MEEAGNVLSTHEVICVAPNYYNVLDGLSLKDAESMVYDLLDMICDVFPPFCGVSMTDWWSINFPVNVGVSVVLSSLFFILG